MGRFNIPSSYVVPSDRGISFKEKIPLVSRQGDTGHAQLKMVSDVYSHILDEDRRYNAEKMERDFYKKAEEKVSTEPTAKPTNAATEQLMNLLNSSPDLAAQLLQMLTANQTGQAVTA